MPEMIFIPFPKDLYDLIVVRSGGKLDPIALAETEVRDFVVRNSGNALVWTEKGLEAFARENPSKEAQTGDPKKGYQWQRLFLPNGTDLRMTYRGRNAYAQVQHEKLNSEGEDLSPSQWVSVNANNTSRNAWRDVWVRFPGANDWILADDLRRKPT